jgi:S1-C subfamily serine protease
VIAPTSSGEAAVWPIHGVASSLPISDLAVFRTYPTAPLRTLPVSMYPAQPYTPLSFQLLHDSPGPSTGSPFLPGLHSSSVHGNLSIYNDAHGREASPGTYDTLAQMMFTPPPTSGASGGPLIDETGTVIGIVLGSRWEGGPKGRAVGLGVPAEAIFEVSE